MKGVLLTFVLSFTALLSSCYSYQALVPEHDIPVGTVIKDSDLRTEWCGRIGGPMVDLADDRNRSRVVGHKALKPLHGGTRFQLSDVSQ